MRLLTLHVHAVVIGAQRAKVEAGHQEQRWRRYGSAMDCRTRAGNPSCYRLYFLSAFQGLNEGNAFVPIQAGVRGRRAVRDMAVAGFDLFGDLRYIALNSEFLQHAIID